MDSKDMRDIKDKAVLWWHARSPRERAILLAWATIATILLLWFAVLSPLSRRIDQLEQRVPELESKLYSMRAQPLNETRTPGAASAADLRSTLFGLLAEKKISGELRALSASRVELRLPELPMKEALELLELLRRESGARVVVLNAKTDPAPATASRLVVELERAS
jgi:type II secretory pathway component PulM